jgi:hypothetical protein
MNNLREFEELLLDNTIWNYQTTFHDFKYEPLSFVYVEIGTSSRILAMPYVV